MASHTVTLFVGDHHHRKSLLCSSHGGSMRGAWILFHFLASPLRFTDRGPAAPSPHFSPHRIFPHLRQIVASTPSALAQYDTEIDKLQQTLKRLSSERNSLQIHSHRCSSLMAPIRRIPPEVLAQIFDLCALDQVPFADADASLPDDPIFRASQGHLAPLSQVCFRWYETVLGTPWLWSIIEADLVTEPYASLDGISRSLERSAHCPLVIRAVAATLDATTALELLAQHSNRWYCLSSIKGNLALLRRLDVDGWEEEPHDLFEIAPMLTDIVLASPGFVPKLPWIQFQTVAFNAARASINEALEIMGLCPPHCAFDLLHLDFSVLTAGRPITSQIWSLQLSGWDDTSDDYSRSVLGHVMDMLTLPCLRRLVFAPFELIPWPTKQFPTFASRSSLCDTLTHLSLQRVVITESELVECLSHTPILLELTIHDVHRRLPHPDHILVTDTLLQRLTATPDPLVPRLSILTMVSFLAFDDPVLLDFVTGRLVSGRTAEAPFRLNLFWHAHAARPLASSVADRLSEFQAAGELGWLHDEDD
ncbi:hypothetical protein C8R46DRAFT_1350843 [Mycena filopes]|nr:hypothetical protein C8R46DRAFT_1350843 [Mycena filopes]